MKRYWKKITAICLGILFGMAMIIGMLSVMERNAKAAAVNSVFRLFLQPMIGTMTGKNIPKRSIPLRMERIQMKDTKVRLNLLCLPAIG